MYRTTAGIDTLSLSVKANRTNGTFGIFSTHKPTLKKPKEPFFTNVETGQLDNYSNILYLEKRDIEK